MDMATSPPLPTLMDVDYDPPYPSSSHLRHPTPMAVDCVPADPSTTPPPTSEHKVSDFILEHFGNEDANFAKLDLAILEHVGNEDTNFANLNFSVLKHFGNEDANFANSMTLSILKHFGHEDANFEDANFANLISKERTLVLAEGVYYGKQLTFSGLSLFGKENYDVFPLKGKLLDLRDEATPERLLKNATIRHIINILDLRPVYQDAKELKYHAKELKYRHLMIMANQGHDASQVIGLLSNFLLHFCPSLLGLKDFLQMCITPMFKAFHKESNAVLSFYTIPEYDAWVETIGNKAIEYKILHYRGSQGSPEESKMFFADIDQHIKNFDAADYSDLAAIGCAFVGSIDERIQYWNFILLESQAGTDVDSKDKSIRYSDFLKKEFRQYLVADRQRSIPSMVDGLTLGQREILSCAFKMPISQEIRVAEFAAYVFGHYPNQREASLVDTIIGMAQNYVGSNNINLLQPIGRFGTRLMGGKDHASGIYLCTQLSPITRCLFHEYDELILNYGDGQSIEPAWFIPIIPMVLVNGSKGRGTECSSFVPKYNPRDIIANLIRALEGRALVPMDPWYKGFYGEIKKIKSKGYTTEGLLKESKNSSTVIITELPVGMSTLAYEEFLKEALWVGKDIKAYNMAHIDDDDTYKVHFEIKLANQMNSAKQEGGGLLKKLKLITPLSTANMYLLNKDGLLKKYATPEDILEEYFCIRLRLYHERMEALIRKLMIASGLLKNKAMFMRKVCNGEILLFPLKEKQEWCTELKTKGIQSLLSIEQEVDNGKETEEEEPGTAYDYLLSIPIASFTYEKITELEQERELKIQECNKLTKSNPRSLWREELEALDHLLANEKYPVKIDVDSEITEEAPKMKAPAKRPAARRQMANKRSRV